MMSRHTPAVRIARSQDSQDMHRDCPENVATLEPAARRGCHHRYQLQRCASSSRQVLSVAAAVVVAVVKVSTKFRGKFYNCQKDV